jgi:predicted nucleic acid-binding protein
VIVVDTNVLAYLVIPGPLTSRAESVRAKDSDWHVPALFRHEWLNVVTRYASQPNFGRDRAVRAYWTGLSMVKVHDDRLNPVDVINLHLRSGSSSYDCQFVAAAEQLGVQLLTVDKETVKAFPTISVGLESF